ncbi:MAG: divergent PAP2 family protein [Christensenellales bacterium]
MRGFLDFINSPYLQVAFLSWFIAQLLKVVLTLVRYNRLDISRMVGSGGMPSSHSAFVMSITTAIGLREGFGSALFALAVVLSLVVMYDAAGVRRAAGKQAKVLNEIVEQMERHEQVSGEKLKELLGHTPVEVIAGAVLGIAIAVSQFFIWGPARLH